jgi:hypothetical protein
MNVKVCSVQLMGTFSRNNYNLHDLQITYKKGNAANVRKGHYIP